MGLKFGFFNSVRNDRLYNSLDIGRMFDGLIHDGVFATLGDHMIVTARGGFKIQIGSGKAWFNYTYTINPTAYPITLEAPEIILNRIDAIVLEVNNTIGVRANSFKYIKGTPAASNPQRPQMIHTDEINQYPLCYITMDAGLSEITQAQITNTIGTSECPFVTAVNQSVTTDELIQNWTTQWNEIMQKREEEWDTWIKEQTGATEDWRNAEKMDFINWEVTVQNDFENWRDSNKAAFEKWWDDLVGTLNEVNLGDFAVRFVQMETDVDHLERHLDELILSLPNNYETKTVKLQTAVSSGGTSVSITDEAIDDTKIFNIYTNIYGVSPKAAEVNEHTLTLTFSALKQDTKILVTVGEV